MLKKTNKCLFNGYNSFININTVIRYSKYKSSR